MPEIASPTRVPHATTVINHAGAGMSHDPQSFLRRGSLSRALLVTLALLVAAAIAPPALESQVIPATAEEAEAFDRGFDPRKVYDSGDLDTINPFNGQLSLVIPLGRTYPVNGNLSFGFTLTYSSQVWDIHSACAGGNCASPEQSGMLAWPGRIFNAGLGWHLSQGRLFEDDGRPEPLDYFLPDELPILEDLERWSYVSPDGGRHLFYSTHDGGVDDREAGFPKFTRDGTYLRLVEDDVEITPGNVVDGRCIEFPGGGRRCFVNAGASGWQEAPFEGDREWRLYSISDAFGNQVTASLTKNAGPGWTWTYTDDHGRPYVVKLFAQGHLNGYARVTEVVLPGVDGEPLSYGFQYGASTPERGCESSFPRTHAPLISTPLLTKLLLPDGTSYQFSYGHGEGPGGVRCKSDDLDGNYQLEGIMSEMQTRTGGHVRWTWKDYFHTSSRLVTCDFPHPPHIDPQDPNFPDFPDFAVTMGIAERITKETASGPPVGRWTYLNRLLPEQPGAPMCDRDPTEFESTLIDPLGNRTIRYFSAYVDLLPGTPNPEGWDRGEYGLPFTRRVKHEPPANPQKPLFLSEKVLTCANLQRSVPGVPENNAAQCELETLQFVRYERDPAIKATCENDGSPSEPTCGDRNQRVERSRIEYHHYPASGANYPGDPTEPDPGPDWVSLQYASNTDNASSSWDTYGHYRRTTTRGTRLDADVTQVTQYHQPDPYATPAGEWILGTYDHRFVASGGVSEGVIADFDRSNGFLRSERVLANRNGPGLPSTNAGKDVRICYGKDGKGNVVELAWYGGDRSPLPAGCSGTPEYLVKRDYDPASGALARAWFQHPTNPSIRLDRVHHTSIDASTGFVLETVDTAGAKLAIRYHDDGRRKALVPEGEAATNVCYQFWNLAGSGCPGTGPGAAEVVVSRTDGEFGPMLTRNWEKFDAFGRPFHSRSLMPPLNPGGPDRIASSKTSYHPNGWVRNTSTPTYGSQRGLTRYEAHDALGRARKVIAPDGTARTIQHFGPEETSVTAPVRTGPYPGENEESQFHDFHERHFRDALGRLSQVRDSTDAVGRTFYSYDASGRLIEVRQKGDGVTDQVRTFAYDGRGLLQSEHHPELGVPGNGKITYGDYDSRGNPGFKRWSDTAGNAVELRFEYDFAGRLIATTDAAGKPLVEHFHGYANDGNDLRRGKIVMTKRHNPDGIVTQSFFYRGDGGKLSEQTTRTWHGDDRALRFVQSVDYDALGNVRHLEYPQCVGSERCPSETVAPRRDLDATFVRGLPEKLTATTWNGAQPVPRPLITNIDYDANGIALLTKRANGVDETVGVATNGMARPDRMQARKGTAHRFDTGAFQYDAMGNVYALLFAQAGDAFFYDEANRLVKTNQIGAAGGTTQEYAYDRFGNLTGVWTDGNLGRGFEVDARTNRLLRRCKEDGPNDPPSGPDCFEQPPNPSPGPPAFHYDVQGNLLTDGNIDLTYDALGSLSHAQGLGVNRSFLYDAGGERIAVLDDMATSETWTLRGLGQQVLRELRLPENGTPGVTDYFHNGAKLAASMGAQGLRHIHLDHLGSVRAITNANGDLAARHKYRPYGEELPDPHPTLGNDPDRMRFAGHERDFAHEGPSDDLDYMHARYYSPWLGRFTALDPVVIDPTKPRSFNRYAYTSGNPLNRVDPDGRTEFDAAAIQRLNTFFAQQGVEVLVIGENYEGRVVPFASGQSQMSVMPRGGDQAAFNELLAQGDKVVLDIGPDPNRTTSSAIHAGERGAAKNLVSVQDAMRAADGGMHGAARGTAIARGTSGGARGLKAALGPIGVALDVGFTAYSIHQKMDGGMSFTQAGLDELYQQVTDAPVPNLLKELDVIPESLFGGTSTGCDRGMMSCN